MPTIGLEPAIYPALTKYMHLVLGHQKLKKGAG